MNATCCVTRATGMGHVAWLPCNSNAEKSEAPIGGRNNHSHIREGPSRTIKEPGSKDGNVARCWPSHIAKHGRSRRGRQGRAVQSISTRMTTGCSEPRRKKRDDSHNDPRTRDEWEGWREAEEVSHGENSAWLDRAGPSASNGGLIPALPPSIISRWNQSSTSCRLL